MDRVLLEVAVLLAAAVVAPPFARYLGIGSVLGYLLAGIVIGPFGLGLIYSVYEVQSIFDIAELGVVMLLFLIGLEIRPRRLWTMRQSVFGLGGAQVALTGLLFSILGVALHLPWQTAILVGFSLSFSSTAFALQVMEENKELNTQHGRKAFAVLLFQDLAAIPLIALAPFFAIGGNAVHSASLFGALKAMALIAALVFGGRIFLAWLLPMVARSKVREAMTAVSLLVVIGAALLMEAGGLSPGLGAFITGALLSESGFRHELEADIAPFEGLLLGLFFTAIGMSLNLALLLEKPLVLLGLVALLLFIKSLVLFVLGRLSGLPAAPTRRFALSISQGGEFAFVIFANAVGQKIIPAAVAETLTVVVTLSMMATPFLLKLDDALRRLRHANDPAYDAMPDDPGFVVIAGFGRFGQIAARLLHAKNIPFTALDISSEQVDFVRVYGSEIYYGDASRLHILESANVGMARALVLAIDDVEASLRTAELMQRHFPHVPVLARARNRNHVHRLRHQGVKIIRRETFGSALDLTQELLVTLGLGRGEAQKTIETFRAHDLKRLDAEFAYYDDPEKLRESAFHYAAELESLFVEDQAIKDVDPSAKTTDTLTSGETG